MTADRADFGSRLRAAREARGLSLKEIAAATKISPLALEALERNDASRLPGGIFSRAFVRAYAKEVGLDPEQTAREFADRFGDGGESETAEARPRVRSTRVEEPAGSHAGARWIGLVVTILLVIAWIGIDRYVNRRAEAPPPSAAARAPRGEVTPPSPHAPALPKLEPPPVPVAPDLDVPAAAASPADQPATTPTPPGTQPPAGQPSITQPPGGQQAPPPAAAVVPPPAEGGVSTTEPKPAPADVRLRVVVSATVQCWVSARTDEQRMPSRTLQPGETLELAASKVIVFTTGNAAGISYTINNLPGRPLGAAGEVKTAVITTSNYRTFVAERQ